MPRQPRTLGPHPCLEVVDEKHGPLPASKETLRSRDAIDLALDRKERIDALDGFDCERGDDGQLPARFCGDVGEHEELAPRVGPTCRFDQWLRTTVRRVEPHTRRLARSRNSPRDG